MPFYLIPFRKKWLPSETRLVLEAFGKYLTSEKLPGKKECQLFLKRNKNVLGDRKWQNIKDFVRNHKVSVERKSKKKK